MAQTLATLRSLFYAYLGTTPADPMYPPTTVNALLSAVATKYKNEVFQADPSYLTNVTTIAPAPGTRDYALPIDFAGWLDVRFENSKGIKLDKVRHDELNAAWAFAAFSITGPDGAATMHLSEFCTLGTALYLLYIQQQPDLVADSDSPTWMPGDFHDLLAREAAIDAYGLGDEAAPAPRFLQETEDRRAMFWFHVMHRGAGGLKTRG